MVEPHFVFLFLRLSGGDFFDEPVLVTSALVLDGVEMVLEIVEQLAQLVFLLHCVLENITDTS